MAGLIHLVMKRQAIGPVLLVCELVGPILHMIVDSTMVGNILQKYTLEEYT